VRLLVLAPQSDEGDVRAGELRVHVLPVGLAGVAGDLAVSAVEARLEGRVGELRGQRPAEARGLEAPHGVRDRGAGHAAGAADLAV
jgi:hypothetical protein